MSVIVIVLLLVFGALTAAMEVEHHAAKKARAETIVVTTRAITAEAANVNLVKQIPAIQKQCDLAADLLLEKQKVDDKRAAAAKAAKAKVDVARKAQQGTIDEDLIKIAAAPTTNRETACEDATRRLDVLNAFRLRQQAERDVIR